MGFLCVFVVAVVYLFVLLKCLEDFKANDGCFILA